MNMRNFKILTLVLLTLAVASCRKEENVSFGVKPQTIFDDKSRKTKYKSEAEYISILYTNLYQTPISPNQLYRTQNVLYSIGDRNVSNEMILSNYFNTGGLKIPSNTEMRSGVEAFVTSTYRRFYLRNPSEAEKAYFINYITNNSNVTVEMVYTAFAVSNEYQYY